MIVFILKKLYFDVDKPSKQLVLYRDLHNTTKLMLVMTSVQLGFLLWFFAFSLATTIIVNISRASRSPRWGLWSGDQPQHQKVGGAGHDTMPGLPPRQGLVQLVWVRFSPSRRFIFVLISTFRRLIFFSRLILFFDRSNIYRCSNGHLIRVLTYTRNGLFLRREQKSKNWTGPRVRECCVEVMQHRFSFLCHFVGCWPAEFLKFYLDGLINTLVEVRWHRVND